MTDVGGIAAQRLQQIVSRIERLAEEKDTIASDIREVYAEAKGAGFDTKIIRKVIALRKLDKAELQEQQHLIDLYCQALGMLVDTPLGEAALAGLRKGMKVTVAEEVA